MLEKVATVVMVVIAATEEQFVLKTTDKLIYSLNDDAHKFAFDIIFVGLKSKLDQVPTMEASLFILHQ